MIREAGSATLPGGTGSTSWKDTKLSDAYSGMIPSWLDAGYFVTKELMVGLSGQYGICLVKDSHRGRPVRVFPRFRAGIRNPCGDQGRTLSR